jgi:alanine-synthesizing transaminase
MVEPAHRIRNVRYAIRAVVAEAKKLEAQGREVLYCNVGDPLKFDFATPPHLIEAVVRAMRDGQNGYAPSPGIAPAREAVAREAERAGIRGVTPDDVIVTTGASEAIDLALTALLDPGDNVLLPRPGYPLYNAVVAKIGAEVVSYDLDEEHSWSLDLAEIRAKITPHTRAIVIGNPNNPTGAVYDRRTLEGLLAIARERSLVVVSDEIYERLTYDHVHIATASLADDVPIVTISGLSKSYLACGWRTGWMVFCNGHTMNPYRAAVLRLAEARLCSPLPPQFAVEPALEGPQDHIPAMMGKLRARRDLVVQRIGETPGLSVVEPQGAFYAMPRLRIPGVVDDEAFVIDLLHATGVLFVHGSGFGEKPGTQHFRIVFLPRLDVLSRALDRLLDYVRTRSREA